MLNSIQSLSTDGKKRSLLPIHIGDDLQESALRDLSLNRYCGRLLLLTDALSQLHIEFYVLQPSEAQ